MQERKSNSQQVWTSVSIILVASLLAFPLHLSEKQNDAIVQSTPTEMCSGTRAPSGWSEDVRLTFSGKVWFPAIAVNGSTIHVVWDNRTSPYELYYRRSLDSGMTWETEKIISNASVSGICSGPAIAVNGSTIHIAYEDDRNGGWLETYYLKSTDNGETWTEAIKLSDLNNSFSYIPYIACWGDNVYVVWQDNRISSQYEVYFKNSSDAGETWSIDKRLTYYEAGTDGPDGIAVNGSNLHMLFGRYVGTWEEFYMNSPDGGENWNVPVMISTAGWISEAGAIAVNGSHVHIIWSDYKDSNAELYYRNSTNEGISWNPEVRLTNDPNFSGTPSISLENDNVCVVFVDDRNKPGTGSDLYIINSTNGGISWNSETRLTYSPNDKYATSPMVAVKDEMIHIVWEDNRDGSTDEAYYKRCPDLIDNSPPDHTNETPPPDSYRDAPGTNISVHVTDPSGVNESTIQLYVNGSLVSHTLTSITDGYNVSYESPGFEPGVVECRIVADDNYSNTLDFTWNFTVLAIYEIQFQEGWNLISVPHVQVDTAIDEVLRDIDGKWNYIQWYDASDPTDKWKTNATYKPQQLNDLFVINRTMAIWINITEPNVNLTVRGHLSTYTEIPLYAGWNFVGYPTQTTETVANALWGTGADRVEVYNATAPYRIKEVGPTYIMKPGEGYWVHVPVDSVWKIDW